MTSSEKSSVIQTDEKRLEIRLIEKSDEVEAKKEKTVTTVEIKQDEEVSEATTSNSTLSEDQQQQDWTVKFYTKQENNLDSKKVDQSIIIKIIGDEGKTRKYKFTSLNEKTFQHGKVEKFHIKTRYVGKPNNIIVKNNEGVGLFLEKIELVNDANQQFVFEHGSEISKNSSTVLNLKIESKKSMTAFLIHIFIYNHYQYLN